MARKKKYTVEVRRYYFVCETFNVDAESEEKAREIAEIESGNKDYTGMFELDEVVSEIFE